MARSTRLRLSDVDAVYRLVNECRELWANPVAWRQHLASGASRLTGMTVAHYGEATIPKRTSTPEFLCHAAVGFSGPSDLQVYEASLAAFPNLFDFFVGSRRLLRDLEIGNSAIARRKELCNDRTWYRSTAYYEYRRRVQSDDNVISIHRHSPSYYSVLDVNQRGNDANCTLRTKRQLELLHRLVQPLIGTALATESQRSNLGLSPQLRTTLNHLLDGLTEKDVAARLHVQPATLHGYVGQIYRHFDVRSRAELMAYFIKRRPKPK